MSTSWLNFVAQICASFASLPKAFIFLGYSLSIFLCLCMDLTQFPAVMEAFCPVELKTG